jgi:hypothetical protein
MTQANNARASANDDVLECFKLVRAIDDVAVGENETIRRNDESRSRA